MHELVRYQVEVIGAALISFIHTSIVACYLFCMAFSLVIALIG